jgi:hypothetical protein
MQELALARALSHFVRESCGPHIHKAVHFYNLLLYMLTILLPLLLVHRNCVGELAQEQCVLANPWWKVCVEGKFNKSMAVSYFLQCADCRVIVRQRVIDTMAVWL